MDTYQPIYDAVRSRLSNADVGAAVEAVFREANISHYVSQAVDSVQRAAEEHERPSAVFRPVLSQDGNAWIALYGEDLQVGVVGCGDSPAGAMRAFDIAWFKKAVVKSDCNSQAAVSESEQKENP